MAAHRIYFAAVERHVKERLVGAAVLVAAAVILIPEMLSGPQREQRNQPAAQSAGQVDGQVDSKGGEPPLKTYTIDLSQSPAAQDAATSRESAAPPAVIEAPAPPPENSESPEAAESAPSAAAVPDQATPESPAVENQPDDATSADAAPAERAAPTPPAAAAPSQRDVAPLAMPPANHEAPARSEQPTQKGWAVQVASFDTQSAANTMSKQLRDKGYDVFVMPFKKGGTTWYRVRIGPMNDRQAAAEVQRKVKETTPGALLVAHP